MDLPADFQAALANYLIVSQVIIDNYWRRMKFTYAMSPVVEALPLKGRYIKIHRYDRNLDGSRGPSESIHAFIDTKGAPVMGVMGKIGDVYKPAGRNAPAKHARGNIFSVEFGTENATEHGPAYLK